MLDQTPTYTIYLLTVWHDGADHASDPQAWRFRLENPKTQERQGYVGLEALMAGLVKLANRGNEDTDTENRPIQ